MKTVLYAGHELLTTDEVADALLDYLVTLPLNQPPQRVVIPALRHGEPVVAEVMLTGTTPVAVTTTHELDGHLDGEEYAIEVLRQKAARLSGIGVDARD